jgi:tripartite-type tricarboxylate transporter receptor subunit TctC
MGQWRGLAAPKGTPPDVIQKLHDAFKKGMDDPVFKKNAKDMAVNLSYMSSSDLGKTMSADHEFYGKLVKEIKK